MSFYRKEIFPITIHHGSIKDNEKIKSFMVPLIEETKDHNKNKVPGGWFTNKLITSFGNDEVNDILFGDTEVGIELQSYYMKTLESFFDDDWEATVENIWYNYYVNGEFQEAHSHLSGSISPTTFACVHFVSFNPKLHSPITFSDPIASLRNLSLEFKSSRYHEKYTPKIKEGDFLMFPSYLQHEVKPSPPSPDYPRITISFNLKILRYGKGKDE